MTAEQRLKARDIADHYGESAQILKCVEELSELSSALMKYINKGKGLDNVFDEIADVEIMLEQMKYLLPYSYSIVEDRIGKKIDRQLDRIAKEKEQ